MLLAARTRVPEANNWPFVIKERRAREEKALCRNVLFTPKMSHFYNITTTGNYENPSHAQCLKTTQNIAFDFFFILTFSTNFCPIKSDLSGNTV